MTARVSEALHGISLEIGRAPRMAFIDDPGQVPAIPEGPSVLALDFEIPGIARRRPFGRLIDAVIALTRHERVSWMIEVHEPEGFARAYHKILDTIHDTRTFPVLLYVPHHGGKRFELSHEDLMRTRSMLEYLGYRAAEEDSSETSSSAGTPLDAARQRRAQLLEEEHWLDGGKVHQQQQGGNPEAPGANNTASRLRRKGELLGAWDGREYLHPAFQFDPKTGRIMPEMKELIEILPKDRGGWRQMFWLFQRHARLDGRRPADVFPSDPQSVIEAARSTFAPGNTNW
jgi:hypothetical protein